MKKVLRLLMVLLFIVVTGCNQVSEPDYKTQIRKRINNLNIAFSSDEKLIKYFTDNIMNSDYFPLPGEPTNEQYISKYTKDLSTYKEKIGIDDVKDLNIKLTIKEISDLTNKDKKYVSIYAYVIWEYTLDGSTVKELLVIECSIDYSQKDDDIRANLGISYQGLLPNYSTYIRN